MKNTLLLLAALATAATASARSLADIKKDGTVVIATEGKFPPMNYFKGNQLTGFEYDLGNALARQMGVKAKWVTQPFDSLLIGLAQDRYDFVIASHGITPERQKAVDFAGPHYCTGGVLVSKVGGPKTAADLKGKTVAVQVGTTYADSVQKIAGLSKNDIRTYQADTDAQQQLLNGRVDGWVTDKNVALLAIKANPNAKLQLGEQLFVERDGMPVKKGNTTLLRALNDALAAVQKNGTYAKISDSYFGQDIRCKQ